MAIKGAQERRIADIKWLIRGWVVGWWWLWTGSEWFAGDMSVSARVKVSKIQDQVQDHARGVSTPACPGGSCP